MSDDLPSDLLEQGKIDKRQRVLLPKVYSNNFSENIDVSIWFDGDDKLVLCEKDHADKPVSDEFRAREGDSQFPVEVRHRIGK